ncbi:MAG: hypothetical protein Q7S25_02050, partial [Candidatus Limnocylindria bacterium]|nr:hypothetical protein [Candidatus Limnocylindria bacterium]
FDEGSHAVTTVPTVGDLTQACTYQRTGRPAHDLEYVATYKNVLMVFVAEPKSGSIGADSRILLQLADLARRQVALVDAPAAQEPVSSPSPAPRQ